MLPLWLPDCIGTLAAFLTTFSFLPQVWMIVRTKNTHGISLLMYSMFTLGVALWGIYGILLMRWPIILANGLTFSLAAVILGITWQERRKGK